MKGKVALVTGSTRGIGAAIARRLASEGARLVVNGRDEVAGETFAEELRREGGDVVFRAADLLDYNAMQELMAAIAMDLGPVEVLVATGAASSGPLAGFFHEAEPTSYLDWALHIWAARLYAVRAALPGMIEAGHGSIVLLSTDAGRWPTPAESVPGGAGAALHLTARTLAREFSRWKIRINVVSTTVVADSPGGERSLHSSPATKIFKKAMARQAFPLEPQDLAEAVAYLASERARSVTGQILSVNGGVSVGI